MHTQQAPREPAPRRRARRRRGQSVVEYALTIVMIFLLAQGPGRAILGSFVAVAQALRSGFTITDDPTPRPGPSPTVRLPPPPATLTPLPPTPTVIAMCEVPNLVGMLYGAAAAEWQNYGFSAGTLTRPSGGTSFVVGSQSLQAGRSMPCATTNMSVGRKMCSVPLLQGQTYSAARDGAWVTSGFVRDNLLPSAGSPSDFTIGGQEYASGTSLDCAATMVVEQQRCTVPNMSNRSYSQAVSAWSGAGFSGALHNPFNLSGSATVFLQEHAPGEYLLCSSEMWVKPQVCTVPDMAGKLYDDVSGNNEDFRNAGFTSTLAKAWGSASPTNRVIGDISPAPGNEIACAATVTVAEKLCTVPDMAGMLYSQATASGGPWRSAGFSSTLAKAWSTNPADRVIGSTSPAAGASVLCSSGSVTATATQLALVVTINDVSNGGSYRRSSNGPRLGATAYDPNLGTSNGTGISQVRFTITGPGGYSYTQTDSGGSYCAFGGSSTCSRWSYWSSLATGDYTITATASSSNGLPAVSTTVTIRVTN